jgi:hypothetical protein
MQKADKKIPPDFAQSSFNIRVIHGEVDKIAKEQSPKLMELMQANIADSIDKIIKIGTRGTQAIWDR